MKVKCTNCLWKGDSTELMVAPNPFDDTDTLNACPRCKALEDEIDYCCEIPNCWAQSTCGTPLKNGKYIRTCGKHMPKYQ